jgi:replicative DNA helicase
MGKSQLAQNISINLAKQGSPILFIGLEMTNLENTQRFIQMLGPEREDIYQLPIFYPKSTDIEYRKIDNVIKTGASEGAKLIVIDHLHAMRMPDANNTNDAIERVMYEIQRVTIKHNLPVLLLSHTSRNGRAGTPPHLHDLRGSGAIEQVTHNALGVWRHEDDLNKMQVYCDKNRMGPGRGMKAELQVENHVRLREMVLEDIFPGIQRYD